MDQVRPQNRKQRFADCASLDWPTGPHPTLSGSGPAPTADRSKTPAVGLAQGNEFRLTDLIGTLPIALRGAFPGRNNGISEQDRTTVAGPNLRSTSKSASDTLRHRGPLT